MPDLRRLTERWTGRRTREQSEPDPLDDAVDAARDGDETAFAQLYRTIQPGLLNYVRAIVGETDAEDVTSEAWGNIARDLRSFRGGGRAFRAWAAVVTRHRAIDHLRGRRPSMTLPAEAWPAVTAGDDVEGEVLDNIDTATALAMIAALPPDQAQAILLRVVVGLDAATAGRILGKRPGAVRTAAHRGLRNLAGSLDAAETDRSPATPRRRGP
ncbi:sigma-70 family RNA polymerase sigma factor [Actinoplanes sp. NPDC051411]|uniref:RNA polymerase sigma factor n=1 Tax=Actinoplanes sp. NPDC051411 TaxID=3155522 RepID=UPI0034121410